MNTPRAVLLLGTLALAGCGSHQTLAGCLNGQGFLVEQRANIVRGSSAGGVNFTLTIYPGTRDARRTLLRLGRANAALIGNTVVDFSGNPPASPGRAPGRLSKAALATIRNCLPAG